MKYLVVGSGSIGKRRIGILNDLGITSIDICDKSETRMDDVCQKYRVEGRYTDYAVALAKNPMLSLSARRRYFISLLLRPL